MWLVMPYWPFARTVPPNETNKQTKTKTLWFVFPPFISLVCVYSVMQYYGMLMGDATECGCDRFTVEQQALPQRGLFTQLGREAAVFKTQWASGLIPVW